MFYPLNYEGQLPGIQKKNQTNIAASVIPEKEGSTTQVIALVLLRA